MTRPVKLFEDDRGNLLIERREAEPSLVGAGARLAGAGAGNVDNGAHSYLITFVTASGETTLDGQDLGLLTVTVADKSANGQVTLSGLPKGSISVTSRRLWRTKANADPNRLKNYFLLDTISDNTTVGYTDNTADSGLDTKAVPSRNTTANQLFLPRLVTTAAHLDDPTGGSTTDAEARTAIAGILDTLQAAGIMAGSQSPSASRSPSASVSPSSSASPSA
jgi:hypothetical protein